MKRMKKLTNILLVIVCCLILTNGLAASVIKRGGRGEGVLEVQEWLIDLGYLDDKADGIFGKKTEKAVKAFQKTIGAKQTGELKITQADELMYLWMDVTGAMEGDGPGEDELREMYPEGCCPTESESEYCWRHFELGKLYSRIHLPNLPDKAVLLLGERLLPQYDKAIRGLYSEWIKSNPKVGKEQLKDYEKALAEHKAAVEKVYGTGTAATVKEMTYFYDLTCVNLCFDLHTAEAN